MWICRYDLSTECEGKYKSCIDCILNKIKAEIQEEKKVEHIPEDVNMWDYICALDRTLSIINKYKIKSEEE